MKLSANVSYKWGSILIKLKSVNYRVLAIYYTNRREAVYLLQEIVNGEDIVLLAPINSEYYARALSNVVSDNSMFMDYVDLLTLSRVIMDLKIYAFDAVIIDLSTSIIDTSDLELLSYIVSSMIHFTQRYGNELVFLSTLRSSFKIACILSEVCVELSFLEGGLMS